MRDLSVKAPDKYVVRVAQLDSYQVCASGGKEPVADAGSEGMSLFAHALVRYVQQESKPYFTTDELGVHLARTVSNASGSRQTPECGTLPEAGTREVSLSFNRQEVSRIAKAFRTTRRSFSTVHFLSTVHRVDVDLSLVPARMGDIFVATLGGSAARRDLAHTLKAEAGWWDRTIPLCKTFDEARD
jgi:hypothetical protein